MCFQDSRGVIWLGGRGTGLYRLISDDMNRFLFKRYGESEGFYEKIVYGVSEDKLGNIWIATESGLSRLLVNSETFIFYNKSDGILDKGYDGNALYFSQRHNCLYCGKTMVCIRFGFGNLLGYLKTMEWWSHQLG